ncbi:MAG: Threonine-tRNA ligase [Candidatus Uhrbacteria bacterium GW2011_GWE2_40_58]|nr:MAG: Threonine-tRNA ligase [Candidatus Uhrbacteria bacterium GW2011_GWF2_40_263]KKR68196.1 MAG: Threonine-tRNA ligase [Candidatus Uhrbacteria bacterium GW2011_GWE2_40_58]OGL97651.1 MAG: threonine--tRNA ligase [Candidatus Uhrbacteria bacterium RIFOXYB2_FULL_41_18]HBK34641.1 threonine--tRNA ligase [Candidatus Uhrbacteria bacterium]HCB55654.1 threonine--tRNA ligase [Candidatus Uhrbacteria bacterium]
MMAKEQLKIMRHSTAHLLAAAIMELYPSVKLGVGPAVQEGFYYDVNLPETITENDLKKIEKQMKKIKERKEVFERQEMSLAEAQTFFEKEGQTFKVELLKDLELKGTTKMEAEELQDVGDRPDVVSLYRTGKFVDLCRGPHVTHTGEIGEFALTKVSGAYWRGDSQKSQMQRVYGVAFETAKELEDYLKMIEEAKKRDHRKLGKELDLFHFSELVGPGLPLWTPKGTILRNQLDEFVWSLRKFYGYEKVTIPHITKKDLYETSGHWEKFKDDLFKITTREGHEFAMKPMNCPHHTQIYASSKRSYRDLPQRYAETTMVYRDEQSGELQGLTRVLCISQDDAHVFCREAQVKQEVFKIWNIIEAFYQPFGFHLKARLSVHDPAKMGAYLGTLEEWDQTVEVFRGWFKERGVEYYEAPGEAAFYGPKVDFIAKDSLGREWQVATIQVDRNMPRRFGLVCVNEKGEDEQVVMIHAAIMGSIERFTAILIEHFAGAFPFWLAPVSLRLVPVSDDFVAFASTMAKQLKEKGIRVEVDENKDGVGKKIRAAALAKIPWTVVIGEKEVAGGEIQVNVFGKEEHLVIPASEFLTYAQQEAELPPSELPEI